MARKSSIKQIVDGITLKEYLLKRLVKQSYRQLLSDNEFKIKTGIKSLGNFYNQTEKLGINLKEVYAYAIESRAISFSTSFEEWISLTRKNCDTSKLLTEKEMLIRIGSEFGLVFADYMNKDLIKTTILDFMSEEELSKKMDIMRGGK